MDRDHAKETELSRPSSIHSFTEALNKSLNLISSPPSTPPSLPPTMPPTMPLPPLPARRSSTASRTIPLISSSSRTASSSSLTPPPKKLIKYGRGKYANVELMPQPSDDPNDPLNWPQWKKELNLLSLLMMAGLIGGMKTVFISTNGAVTSRFQVSHLAIAALTAVPLMVSALTGLLSVIVARRRGKRPVYLGSAVLVLAGSIWSMFATDDFYSCMGARVLQSLGWGAFDTLLMESIQDTYFEHERNLRFSISNVLAVATMWGSPIVGGVISHKSQTFTAQYRFISGFFLIALPLLVIGAPETAFDRAGAAVAPTPNSAFVPPASWAGPEMENGEFKLSRKTLKPWSFKGDTRLSTLIFQILRAFAAPTTILVFLLTFIPYVVLWCLASSLAQLLSPSPKDMDPPHIGVVMSGPLLLAVLSVCCLLFYRTSYSKLTCRTTYLIVACGTTCAVAGVLAYGLYLHQHIRRLGMHQGDHPTEHHSEHHGKPIKHNLPLLSFQLGLVAAGSDALGATIRPLLSRSASFTASSMAVAQRSIGNMYSAVIVMRNLFAGLFVLAMPWIVAAAGGLKWTAIIVGSVQAGFMVLIVGLMFFFDESIWKLDGKVMGLLDLRSLRISAGFFDSD